MQRNHDTIAELRTEIRELKRGPLPLRIRALRAGTVLMGAGLRASEATGRGLVRNGPGGERPGHGYWRYRIGSWLYHWGSRRLDLHIDDYRNRRPRR